MITSDQVLPLREIITPAQTILVIIGPQATPDQLAAATALSFSLQAAGKQVTLASPQEVSPETGVMGAGEIQTKLGNKDLSISFEYEPTAVDKVSYHIDEETQRFHLIVKPQRGQKPLDPQTVEFSYSGAEADLIFLVGVHSFESLEQLYFGFEQLYQSVNSIVFHSFEPSIGTIRLSTGDMSCLSEGVAGFLQYAQLPITSEAATNLLFAIEEATEGFHSLTTTADTFERVAVLLRNGARRSKKASGKTTVTALAAGQPNHKANKKNGFAPNGTKKKMGDLSHQPSEFSVGGRG